MNLEENFVAALVMLGLDPRTERAVQPSIATEDLLAIGGGDEAEAAVVVDWLLHRPAHDLSGTHFCGRPPQVERGQIEPYIHTT